MLRRHVLGCKALQRLLELVLLQLSDLEWSLRCEESAESRGQWLPRPQRSEGQHADGLAGMGCLRDCRVWIAFCLVIAPACLPFGRGSVQPSQVRRSRNRVWKLPNRRARDLSRLDDGSFRAGQWRRQFKDRGNACLSPVPVYASYLVHLEHGGFLSERLMPSHS